MAEQKKLAFVDALRGIAVLAVVLSHSPLPASASRLTTMGAHGVQLFFVVSAFTLFLSMEAKYHTEHRPNLNFFVRRFFRIAPAFYFAAMFYLLKDGWDASFWAPDGIHVLQIASALLFLHGWHPETINAIVPGGWSIAVEMTFYLFVPLCFIFIRSVRAALFASFILLVAGVVLGRLLQPQLAAAYGPDHIALVNYFIQLWFPSQACVFPLGFALFYLFRNHVARSRDAPGAAVLISLSAYLCLAFSSGGYALLPSHLMYGLAFVLLGYALAVHPFKFLVNPVLCHIGKVSFSVYLFHFWVLSLVKDHIGPLITSINPYAASLVFYVCATFFSVAVATLAYLGIEKPGQMMGRMLIERLEAHATLQSP